MNRDELQTWLAERTEKVEGCLLWTRGVTNSGFPQVRIEGTNVLVHRFVFAIMEERHPRTVLLNVCGNRRCVLGHVRGHYMETTRSVGSWKANAHRGRPLNATPRTLIAETKKIARRYKRKLRGDVRRLAKREGVHPETLMRYAREVGR